MVTAVDVELVAGHPALDFVNTVEGRLSEEPQELMHNTADLAIWAWRAHLLSTDAPRGRSAAELEQALALRSSITLVLDAHSADAEWPTAALGALAEQTAAAHLAGRVERTADGRMAWCWDDDQFATVRHRIAIAAGELLARDDLRRVRRCEGPGCGWYFLDATKRGNRRWCSMGRCGQAAKAARRRSSELDV